MSAKLIKYDLLALARVLLPVQLGILGVCILTAIGFTAQLRMADGQYFNDDVSALYLMNALLGFGVLLLGAVFLAGFLLTLVLVVRHFYLNIYSDEGYLTMTLPASIHQHIISKAVSGFIWVLINGLVILLGIAILIFFGTAYEGLINVEAIKSLGDIFSLIAQKSPLLVIVYPLGVLVGALSQLLCVYACLAGGAAWAKRHRVALAIGLIFAVYVVTSIMVNVGNSVVTMFTGDVSIFGFFDLGRTWGGGAPLKLYDYYLWTSLLGAVINIALIVAYYAFMHHALANRLNLE